MAPLTCSMHGTLPRLELVTWHRLAMQMIRVASILQLHGKAARVLARPQRLYFAQPGNYPARHGCTKTLVLLYQSSVRPLQRVPLAD